MELVWWFAGGCGLLSALCVVFLVLWRRSEAGLHVEELAKTRAEGELEDARRAIKILSQELGELRTIQERAERALSMMEVALPQGPRALLSAEERAKSQRILIDLLVQAQADAVGLCDEQGLLRLYRGGLSESVRLAAHFGIFSRALNAIEDALGEPWSHFSVSGLGWGLHYMRLDGHREVLGLLAGAESPLVGMKQARLRLTGDLLPAKRPAQVELFPRAKSVFGPMGQALSDVLLDWHKRWGGEAILVFDHTGRIMASTEPPDLRLLGHLVPFFRPLLARAWRDQVPMEEFDCTFFGESRQLTFRILENMPMSPCVLILSDVSVVSGAFDSLSRTMRWVTKQDGRTDAFAAAG